MNPGEDEGQSPLAVWRKDYGETGWEAGRRGPS